jgi:hypothetical protein
MSTRSAGDHPRRVTAHERAAIRPMLIAGAPGAVELRAQLDAATVSAHWPPDGSPSIDIAVPDDVPTAPVDDGSYPVDAQVRAPSGEYLGELILWIAGGRLAALEFAWVTDDMPTSLPAASGIRVGPRLPAP